LYLTRSGSSFSPPVPGSSVPQPVPTAATPGPVRPTPGRSWWPTALLLLTVMLVATSMIGIVAKARSSSRARGSAVASPSEPSSAPTPEVAPKWRRYAQQTVAVTPGSGGSRWFPCTINPTPGGLIVRARLTDMAGVEPASAEAVPRPADLAASTFESSRAYVVVPLVDPATAASTRESAWEQQLGRTTTTLGGLRPLWVRFVDRADPAEMSWEPVQAGTSTWAGAASEFRGPSHLKPTYSRTLAPYGRSGARRVTHYVGTPVPTIAGWRLRVGGALGEASQVVTRSKGAGEDLIGADELAVAPTGVLVLQAEPVDGPPEPLGRLREGMASLARLIILQGAAGGVLLVPPLPDLLAAKVIDSVWRFADTSPEDYHPVLLLDLLDDVQVTVASAEPPVSAMGDRPSLDVCLFL
jgi:hypothetical protein